jgi:hypothetical protein
MLMRAVARSIRKRYSNLLCALCNFGRSVGCIMVVALVKPNIVDLRGRPDVRSGFISEATTPNSRRPSEIS